MRYQAGLLSGFNTGTSENNKNSFVSTYSHMVSPGDQKTNPNPLQTTSNKDTLLLGEMRLKDMRFLCSKAVFPMKWTGGYRWVLAAWQSPVGIATED